MNWTASLLRNQLKKQKKAYENQLNLLTKRTGLGVGNKDKIYRAIMALITGTTANVYVPHPPTDNWEAKVKWEISHLKTKKLRAEERVEELESQLEQIKEKLLAIKKAAQKEPTKVTSEAQSSESASVHYPLAYFKSWLLAQGEQTFALNSEKINLFLQQLEQKEQAKPGFFTQLMNAVGKKDLNQVSPTHSDYLLLSWKQEIDQEKSKAKENEPAPVLDWKKLPTRLGIELSDSEETEPDLPPFIPTTESRTVSSSDWKKERAERKQKFDAMIASLKARMTSEKLMQWVRQGIVPSVVAIWIEQVGLQPHEHLFAKWLVTSKQLTAEQILNQNINLDPLRKEFADYTKE